MIAAPLLHGWAQPPMGHGRPAAPVTVSGRIVDAAEDRPLVGAAVVLKKNADGQRRFWGFTNSQGYFEIKATPGTYHLGIRMIGYADTGWRVRVPTEDVFLGEIRLQPQAVQLDEAQVAESAYEEGVDRLEILVTDQFRKGTNSARQLMEKIPGVEYDPFSDAIRVDNKSNVLLLVNGMEKSDEYIKNIDPARIRKVEIYRDPTGRYGLEGYSAVINLLLRDDYVGYNVSYSTMVAVSPFRKYSPEWVPFQFHRFSATRTFDRFSLYANLGYFHPQSGRIQREETHRDDGSEWLRMPPDTLPFNAFFEMEGYRVALGLDYFPREGEMVSAEVQRRGDLRPSVSRSTTLSVDSRLDDTTLISTTSSSNSGSERLHLFGNLKVNPNNRIEAGLIGRRGRSESTTFYSESETQFTRQENVHSDDRNLKLYADWRHIFNAQWEVSSGYVFAYREDFGLFSTDLYIGPRKVGTHDTSYLNTLNRHQAYAYLTFKRGRWTFKGGSAAETFRLFTEAGSYTFTMPQPSLDVLWKFHKILSLRWKYRSEIRYPSRQELSTFQRMVDRYTYREGNPNLRPFTIHRASVQLGAMGGRARIEPYGRYTRRYIAETLVRRGDSLIYRPENAGEFTRYGVEFSVPVPLGKKLFMMLSGDVYAERLRVGATTRRVADFTSFVMIAYRFLPSFSVGMMQMNHMARQVTPYGYRLGTNRHSDLALLFLRGAFWNDRLNLSVSYVTDFKIPWIDYANVTYTEAEGLRRTVITEVPTARGAISFRASLVFNKGKVRQARRSDDEPREGFMF